LPVVRVLGLVLIATLVTVSCAGDDGADEAEPAPSGTVAGPTTSTTASADCLLLADEYLVTATELFTASPPSDAVVDQSRSRFEELDLLAGAAGCGDDYRGAVCDGLDDLTLSGTLVIYPMVTAQCI
jgi:hypothetical protein